jgi:hypothetical protein
MSKLNMLIFLNSYGDHRSTNTPNHNGIKWTREISAIPTLDAGDTSTFVLAAGESRTVFDTTRTLGQNNTTRYGISLLLGSSNTYVLSAVGGSLPNFRTPRTTDADNTTQVSVTTNGPVSTFSSTGGTPFNLINGGVVVGDQVLIGNIFNAANQGTWKVIAVTATSFSVANPNAVAEGPFTLGINYLSIIQIFSAAGVQVNDTLVISSGFSPVSWGSYYITSVSANSLQFYTTAILPQQSSIMTEIAIYENAKKFVYLEADQLCNVSINGSTAGNVQPWIINNTTVPGQYMMTATVYSMVVTNASTSGAHLMLASVE